MSTQPLNPSSTVFDESPQETLNVSVLPLLFLQFFLFSLFATCCDFGLFYLLYTTGTGLFTTAVFIGKCAGIVIKYGLFCIPSLLINRVAYKNSRMRFLITTGLSAFFSITLIDLFVVYAGQPPIQTWVLMSSLVWCLTVALVVLFGKILHVVGKSSLCSLTASLVDFMMFNLVLAALGNGMYVPANLLSKFCGATTSFCGHKYWAFKVRHGGFGTQYGRYILISFLGFLLNTGIIKISSDCFGFGPRIGWFLAGLLVWLFWSFFMTRLFVFKLSLFHDRRAKKQTGNVPAAVTEDYN